MYELSHFFALIMTLCEVWSYWTYPLPYYSVFTADTLLYAVILNICSAAYDAMKLCTKFEDIRAIHGLQLSYRDFSIW